ncbi:MAG: hypothetical protein Q4D85_11500 [Corynebacterium sp.]|uniref:hypothetical protein n=1 Tax=Corynebacterium sp. TaxID=1720 RepID=UPI0026DD6B02|nr:hypothetical protein [Corynebacterium sp.]MDO5099360.1 hypothetical protein [Corynebacterium sp.]
MIDVANLEPFLTPFPQPSDVFAGTKDEIDRAARLLLPLVSIDLAAFDPTYSGTIHVVCPVEPYECILGEGTDEFHSRYACDDWIGFQLNDDNTYSFLGDWQYFQAEHPTHALKTTEEFRQFYADAHAAYQLRKTCFAETGTLKYVREESDSHAEPPASGEPQFISQWAGLPPNGNWEGNDTYPLIEVETDSETGVSYYPLTEDGRMFQFIASVDSFSYVDFSWQEILTFFDPKDRIVLFTFERS